MSRFRLNIAGQTRRADDIRVDKNGNYEIIEPYSHEVKKIPRDAIKPGSIQREDKTILPGGNVLAPKFKDGLA
jgi:hypothetical protein